MDIITEIQNWYQNQCDGDWEHSQGIKIETLDNPGWWVKIDLKDTLFEGKTFDSVSKNIPQELIDQALGLVKTPFMAAQPNSGSDWLHCYIKDNVFNGAGDPSKLEEILKLFLNWLKK